jgi:hypothetical protein
LHASVNEQVSILPLLRATSIDNARRCERHRTVGRNLRCTGQRVLRHGIATPHPQRALPGPMNVPNRGVVDRPTSLAPTQPAESKAQSCNGAFH